MSPSHLLDTSVFSQPIKDKPIQNVLNRWSELGDQAVCTSAICLAEVLQGLRFRESPKYWRRYRDLIEHQYPVLPFDAEVADTFSKMVAEVRIQGRPRPTLDLMIAATAAGHGLILATLNAHDFTGLPDVMVEDWT